MSILLYANDIAVLASTPEELQLMLDTMVKKLAFQITSKIVNFRPKSVEQVEHIFHCGPTDIDLAKTYTYLGFLFREHNDLTVGAQALAQSASKALSVLLCKTRLFWGTGFCHFFRTFPYRDC